MPHTCVTSLGLSNFRHQFFKFLLSRAASIFYSVSSNELSVNRIMAKVEPCIQSSNGARPPKCGKEGLNFCPSCLDALALYEQVKAFRAVRRIKRNRDSARRSKLIKEEAGSDLHADDIALQAEYIDLAQELEDIERANNALAAPIRAKFEQRITLDNARKLRSMTSDGPRPPRK